MPVAEVFLGAFLKVLFERLTSRELWDLARREGIHSRLKKLSKTLEMIQAVLVDAEKKQIQDLAVKRWLENIRDLAYDVEDILDEFTTETLHRKLTPETQASTSKVRKTLIPTCFTGLNPSAISFKVKMHSKIKEIDSRLQEISKQRVQLGLERVVGETSMRDQSQRPIETTSYMFDPRVYGREDDKGKIIELLLLDQRSTNKVDVIPIYGLGGVGKTTLAQHVFNDEIVQRHFNLKAWVCISNDFDVKRITKAILESFTSQASDLSELNQLQAKLNETLAGKKILLVLDDVWNRKYAEWDRLRPPFGAGAQGSKIIVTTRDDHVASMMGTIETHFLKLLSDNDCWSVFVQHAFVKGNVDVDPNLMLFRKKVVEKCKGLPLVAKSLGSLLRNKLDVHEWEDILNNEVWDLFEENDDIPMALRLSYYHLPAHLKPCFSYCSILPKDYEFEEMEIVLLWMAKGLIPRLEKPMEDLGVEYFRELLSRSFFQPSRGKICFKLEGDQRYIISQKARHLSYVCSQLEGKKKFEAFEEAKLLRSFLPFNLASYKCVLTSYVPLNLLPKLRCLRVLSLRCYSIRELPDEIGKIKHLRYLDLSYACIRSLPESLCSLCNLQTLILKKCKKLRRLPTKMGKLINLRHLDCTGTYSLQDMPLRMGALTSLLTLSNFIVGKGSGSRIEELRNLLHLRGKMSIYGLQNVLDPLEARGANLMNKQGLNVLLLNWDEINDFPNQDVEVDVLDELRPHLKLKELYIKRYNGGRFPAWIGDPSFSNMTVVSLRNCGNCTFLPPLGRLPALKNLHIDGMKEVKSVGREFYGADYCSRPFPSLEILEFADMQEWEDWCPSPVDDADAQGGLPRLRELYIRRCPKLGGRLPGNLPLLKRLDILDCKQLVVSFPSFPSLCTLNIHGWDTVVSLPSLPSLCTLNIHGCDTVVMTEVVNLGSLSSVTATNIREVDVSEKGAMGNIAAAHQFTSLTTLHVDRVGVSDEGALGNIAARRLTSVTYLHIGRIDKLAFLPQAFIQGLTKLKELQINECKELRSLGQMGVGLQRLKSLRRLEITNCAQLVSLVEEEEQEEGKQEALPCGLEYLKLYSCLQLKKLPRCLFAHTSLRELSLVGCPSLISFPDTGLPSTLKVLDIRHCKALQSLPETMMHGYHGRNTNLFLEDLIIRDCPSLACLASQGTLPRSLKKLCVFDCENLEWIAKDAFVPDSSLEFIGIRNCRNLKSLPDGFHGLRFLNQFVIRWCDNLASLPHGGLPTANLREFDISGCQKLRELPNRLRNLTSLQRLEMEKWPGSISFLKGDFPGNLELLIVDYSDLVSFPEEDDGVGVILPSSLHHLSIMNCPNLEKLSSKSFRNLTSLEFLDIEHCPKLASVPEELLPPSLLRLRIIDCPLLKSRFEKGKGRLWRNIAYIPSVIMQDREDR